MIPPRMCVIQDVVSKWQHPQRVCAHVAGSFLLSLFTFTSLLSTDKATRIFHAIYNVTLLEWEMYVGVLLRRLVTLSGTWRTNMLCFFSRVRKEEILWKQCASYAIFVDRILHYLKAT